MNKVANQPKQDNCFKSFELLNGERYFLAVIDYGIIDVFEKFAYVTQDKKKVVTSVFSGGETGGGVDPVNFEDIRAKFVKFV